jgi:hypothetical protein
MLETNEQTNKWEKKESGPIILDRLLTGALKFQSSIGWELWRAPVIQLLGNQSWWTV